MSQRITLYDVLGIGSDADEKQIRDAFRKLTLKYHPDRYLPDQREKAEKRFQEITEAFNVLSHPESKLKYDREIALSGGTSRATDPKEIGKKLAAKGAQEYKAGHLSEALENLELAVHHDDTNSRAHYFLGMTLFRVPGQQREALRHLDQAAQLEPGNTAIKAEAARCFLVAGMHLRARRLAEETLEMDPTSSKAADVLRDLASDAKAGGERGFGRPKGNK